MIRRNFKPHCCDLDANGPESIHRAVTLAQVFSVTNALAAEQSAKLAILVEEAVTNLYDHGDVPPGFGGSLALDGDTDAVRIRLSDSGKAFDLRAVDEIDQPNLERGGGAGLAIIRAWAEIADYRSENGINRLDLTMRG